MNGINGFALTASVFLRIQFKRHLSDNVGLVRMRGGRLLVYRVFTVRIFTDSDRTQRTTTP